MLIKIENTNLTYIYDTEDLVDRFENTINHFLYCKITDPKDIKKMTNKLLETYNRKRFWFAFELCFVLNAIAEDMREENQSEKIHPYLKPYQKLCIVRNTSMNPQKKKNMISNIKQCVDLYVSDEIIAAYLSKNIIRKGL